jgi:magnesium-protoporphyrin O-methyltransferase
VLNQLDVQTTATESEKEPSFPTHDQTDTCQRVAKYFQTSGFSRWAAIYGDGGIPPIWKVIREGHDRAMNQVIDWIADDRPGVALDAGCGVGSLATRLADNGYEVHGFDLSAAMVSFARYITRNRSEGIQPKFYVGDIAAVDGAPKAFDLVCCLDVLFHYPADEVQVMVDKLTALCSNKLIGSFAIKTPLNSFWMTIGKRFFHRKNRMTSLYLLSYDEMEQMLYRAGFRVTRTRRVKRFFYDSFVFEAVRR